MNKLKLKFDTINMDTQLAEVFLRENETIFKEIAEKKHIKILAGPTEKEYQKKKLQQLLQKVEENSELFAQLEALQNGVPKEETKNFTLPLLIQYVKKIMTESNSNKYSPILLVLNGLVNGPFSAKSKDPALGSAVLFNKLYEEFGYPDNVVRVSMSFPIMELKKISSMIEWGCIGVVAERSDFDSAVDILLNSATKLRCSLRRLLIQESVYDRFKKTVAWKCKLAHSASGDDTTNVDKLSILCSEAHVYGEKLLLFDYAGDSNEIQDPRQVIVVEAYRTVKELISLVAKYEPFSLSLWASDTSEAQEIPQLLSVPVIWVNDFGKWYGPPRASSAFYNNIENCYYNIDNTNEKVIIKSHEAWLKLSVDARKERLQKALQNIKSGANDIDVKVLEECETALESVTSTQFVEIKNGRMCVGIEEPAGLLYINSYNGRLLQEIVEGVVHGNGIVWEIIDTDMGSKIYSPLLMRFESEGLPFYDYKKLRNANPTPTGGRKVFSSRLYNTRVVYTNFGTVFAN